jgi:2-oxo-4-hydroxy-4-carboxy--5-ureidoimidazoline (OHCU) decarboxylase
VHELPRQLSIEELETLFEGHTQLTEELVRREDPLGQARAVLAAFPEEAQVEALNTHPRIGEQGGSEQSAGEQGPDDDPALLAALRRLNNTYEEKFGFRFVVFVNRRPRAEILSVLRERLQHERKEELGTGLDELVAIALDRWQTR